MSYRQVIAAITSELERRHCDSDLELAYGVDEVVTEIIECQRRMPDYLSAPMWILTQVFDFAGVASSGTRFCKMDAERQTAQMDAWKGSRLEFCRNFVRFYESLYLLIVLQEDAG